MNPTAPSHTTPITTAPAPLPRVVSGLKPTGRLQLGNYLGAIHPLRALEEAGHELVVLVADLHAHTTEQDPVVLRQRSLEIAATLMSCGLTRTHIVLQSSLAAHTTLSYLLECTATHGEMSRMTAFKEKAAAQDSVRFSLLSYPALMAADILVHDGELVPVGEDQRQHLELAVTLARRLNARYGEVCVEPRGITPATARRVRDLADPSVKMGKSSTVQAGVVHLDDAPDEISRKIRRAVTDADPGLSYDPVGRPGVSNLAEVLAGLRGCTPEAALEGLHGSGQLKKAVEEAVQETLAPIREARAVLLTDPARIRERLRAGGDAVAGGAQARVGVISEAMGLGLG